MGKRTKKSSGPVAAKKTKVAKPKEKKSIIGDPRQGAGDTGKNDGIEGSVTNPTLTAQQQAELKVNQGKGEGFSHGAPGVAKGK